MDRQQIFDTVKNHLLAQRERSYGCAGGSIGCKYRLGDMKCAVGVLIPDELYRPEMEGRSVSSLISFVGLNPSQYQLPEWFKEHRRLLEKLQVIHDTDEPYQWEQELRELAVSEKLKYE
jgi:hypothetical protein